MPSSTFNGAIDNLTSSLTDVDADLGGVANGQPALASQFDALRTSMSLLSTFMTDFKSGGWLVNADVASTAAIGYGKLALSNSIVSGDLTSNSVTTAKIADSAVTSAKIAANTIVAADIGVLPAAKVKGPANTILNATTEYLLFTSESFKSGVTHSNSGTSGTSTDPRRLTIVTAGVYLITASIAFETGTGGTRILYIRKNGNTTIAASQVPPVSGIQPYVTATTIDNLSAGDYLEVGAYQNSGGSLDVVVGGEYSPVFGVTWLGKDI